jgi:hypothetical protein
VNVKLVQIDPLNSQKLKGTIVMIILVENSTNWIIMIIISNYNFNIRYDYYSNYDYYTNYDHYFNYTDITKKYYEKFWHYICTNITPHIQI